MDEEVVALVITLVVTGGPLLVWMIHVLARSAVTVSCHARDVELKLQLAQRGMDPADIERIVMAGRSTTKNPPLPAHAKGKPKSGKPPKLNKPTAEIIY